MHRIIWMVAALAATSGGTLVQQEKPALSPPKTTVTERSMLNPPASVVSALDLSAREIAALDRAYERYAVIRLAHEAEIAELQDGLKREQSDTPRADRIRADLTRRIKSLEQRIASAFLYAHATAVRALMGVHQEHLAALPHDSESFQNDRYRQLLAMNAEELWATPVDSRALGVVLVPDMYVRRSPNPYRYYSAPLSAFTSYGYGALGSSPIFPPAIGRLYLPDWRPYVWNPNDGWHLSR